MDGGTGNDTITGGDGADLLFGGDGNDTITGGRGNDTARMGAGDDTFVWNPGDGSDIVEGEDGTDTMLFNGANIGESFDVSANGSRVRFTRNIGTIVMDLNDVETVNLNALGGADIVTVNDMTGTDLTQFNTDLSAGGVGDGAADNVIVNATKADDVVIVAGAAGSASVFGLSTQINVAGAEPALDRLTVNGLAGDDVVEASSLSADAIGLTENGGDGNDILIGGAGDDTLNGNAGDDILIGGPGNDVFDGAPGSDVVIQSFTTTSTGGFAANGNTTSNHTAWGVN
jgi:Ca2+-binding RTX toxin-like protein